MSANGGQVPASRRQGAEQTGDTADHRHGGGGQFPRVVVPQEGGPRGSRVRLYDDSLSEFRAHADWARGQAGKLFTVACSLLVIELLILGLLGALANVGIKPASELLTLIGENKLLTVVAAMSPSTLLIYAGFTILNHISRTHDEMTTADSKRGAALLPLTPARIDNLAMELCEVDRNPKLLPDETLADIERQRQTIRPYLTFLRDTVRWLIGPGGARRIRNSGGTTDHPDKNAG
jgi:hypothetical protein